MRKSNLYWTKSSSLTACFHNARRWGTVTSNSAWLLPLCATVQTCQARSTHWYNSVTIILGATNYFPIYLLPTTQKETHKWYCKPEQNPRTREVIGPSGKPTAVALLSKCDVPVKLSFKHLCLCLWIMVPVGLKWSRKETLVSDRKDTADSQPHCAFEDRQLLLWWRQIIRPLDHLSGLRDHCRRQDTRNAKPGIKGEGRWSVATSSKSKHSWREIQ